MRRLIAFLHHIGLRFVGLLCLVTLLALFDGVTELSQVERPTILAAVPIALCLLFCWMPRLPRPLRDPQRVTDMVTVMFVSAVVPAAALLYRTPDPRLLPELGRADPVTAAAMAAPLLVTGMLLVAMRPKAVGAPMGLPKRVLDGPIWKLYLLLDWFAMRAIGLGLVAVGAALWQLQQIGRGEFAVPLSFGQPAEYVPYVPYAYAAVGVLMALPLLLPTALHRPKGPGQGIMKALLVLGSGILLFNGVAVLWPGAAILASPVAIPAEITAFPKADILYGLQMLIAATAFLSVVMPTARRAAGLRYDQEGRPIVTMSNRELRHMRHARTPAS